MNPLAVAAEWLLSKAVAACATTPSGSPAQAYVSYGQPAWDDCCEGAGQLTVAFAQPIVPTQLFPAPYLETQLCGISYAVPLIVELLRCAPSMNDDGTLPSLAVLNAAALSLTDDAWALLRGIQCALGGDAVWVDGYDGLITSLVPVPPGGGCAGVQVGATLWLTRF